MAPQVENNYDNGLIKKLMDKLEELKISAKPAPVDYWTSDVELVAFRGPIRPDRPAFQKANETTKPVAIYQIDIIFDTQSATNFAEIHAAGVPIFRTRRGLNGQSPYHGTNVSLDLRPGLVLDPSRTLDIFLWDTDNDGTGGANVANVYAAFGGI